MIRLDGDDMALNIPNMVESLKKEGMLPSDYLSTLLRNHDIILLGEHHAIKENIQCLIDAIPQLYEAGMRVLGMEFGCAEDQRQLDNLVMGDVYDESLARQLFFNYNTLFAYQDYQAIYKAVFQFNQTRFKNSKKLRILNLSYQYHWHHINTSPNTIHEARRVFHKGGTEWFRFKRIQKHVIECQEKMVALVGNIHAYTKYEPPVFDYLAQGFIRHENRHMGHLIKRYTNARVKTVLFHEYLPALETGKHIQPADGMIERVMSRLNHQPLGFDLSESMIGDLKDHSFLATGYQNFKLKDLADGYLYLKPLAKRQGASVDKDYLHHVSLSDVLANFPDPDWHETPNSLESYWLLVSKYVDLTRRYQPIENHQKL